MTFLRARKPEEQQQRREAILAAAAELFDAGGEQAAGLTAIASKAGFTKSNVYRYFESREEVLLSLFVGELEGFVGDFEAALAACQPGDTIALSEAAARCFANRPRFCALMSILSSVLEHNVSENRIIEMKRAVTSLGERIAIALANRLPGASLENCAWAANMSATLVAGMWPNANPSSAAARVLTRPEFTHLKLVIDRDLARAIAALLQSIV